MSNIFDIELAQRHPFATSMVAAAINTDRLSHAYLLSGRALDDKWSFARQVAAHLNCANRANQNDAACHLSGLPEKDFCVNCKWINQGKHPQAWLTLTSEGSKSRKIAVEKARLLSDELSKHSEFFRVAVVEDSSQEAFHRPSANALLKTIEDPGARCLFFLFAAREDDVLPTVVSRCQVIPMQSPPEKPSPLASVILKTGADEVLVIPELKNFSDSVKQIFKHRDSHLNLYALDLSRQIQIAIEEIENPDAVLDLATNLEISRVGERASADSATAGYLADLLSLAEEVKLQIGHYVSSKAAIETFVLSWWRLRRAAGC
jgi:DNA polymerase III delta prime subunit